MMAKWSEILALLKMRLFGFVPALPGDLVGERRVLVWQVPMTSLTVPT